MSLIVQKYGGTSVGDIDRIRNVARRAIAYSKRGHKLVVVVSAMAGQTDHLIRMAREINPHPDKREMDMLVSTGEQVSIALLAMAIKQMGKDAISMTGTQAGILTDQSHTKAKIEGISTALLRKHLSDGRIVIIAGFQGVDLHGNITTLGRGGSDTTAVAVAAALKADECEIYTDVDGVYTADPRIVPEAKRLNSITHAEMLELASTGAKVLHSRSVIFAKKYNVKLVVKSSFDPLSSRKGTVILKECKDMEKIVVTGVTSKNDEAKISVRNLPDRPGVAAKLFGMLAENDVSVNLIVQNSTQKNVNDISFTVPQTDLHDAVEVTKKSCKQYKLKPMDMTVDKDISIVSLIGSGMKSHSGVASKMFEFLYKKKINLQMISTSEIKISAVIKSSEMKKAVRVLHQGFDLHKLKR